MQAIRPVFDSRWRVLDAAFAADAAPGVSAALPAAAAGLSFAVSRELWAVAWLLLSVLAVTLRARVAQAYAVRPASDDAVAWAARYRIGCVAEAAMLGFGLGLGIALGQLNALLAAVAAVGFRLGGLCAMNLRAEVARPAMMAMIAPVVGALLAAPSPAGLGLLAFLALAGASLFMEPAISPVAALAAAGAAGEPPPPVPQAVQDFQRLLGRDQVTGLPNRPGFLRMLAEESLRAVRAQSPLALLLISVDNLPMVVADSAPAPEARVVSALGDAIKACLRRQSDQLASLGTGRFAVLLPFTDAVGATAAARNIATALAPTVAGADGEEEPMARGLSATLSIGLAAYSGRGMLPETQLLGFAEEAEAAARRTGGNRISRYDPMATTLRPLTFTERQGEPRRPAAAQPALQTAPEHSSAEPE